MNQEIPGVPNTIEALKEAVRQGSSEPSPEQHPSDISRFKGLLTDSEAEQYHQYLQKARQEWDRGE
jgi:hypothetical protein